MDRSESWGFAMEGVVRYREDVQPLFANHLHPASYRSLVAPLDLRSFQWLRADPFLDEGPADLNLDFPCVGVSRLHLWHSESTRPGSKLRRRSLDAMALRLNRPILCWDFKLSFSQTSVARATGCSGAGR